MPGQPGDRRVLAAPGHVPLGQQRRDEPVGYQALGDRLRRAGRHHCGRDRAPARPPVPAAVCHHPDGHLSIQLLDDMITQPGERRPALRAAVPAAGEVPDHLHPGQTGVILSSRPGPQPARPAVMTAARPAPGRPRPARRIWSRPLLGSTEHQALQHRQLSGNPLQLGIAARQLLPQPRVLSPQLIGQPRQPLVRLQRLPQRRVICRLRQDSHETQQAPPQPQNHASRARVAPATSTQASTSHLATPELGCSSATAHHRSHHPQQSRASISLLAVVTPRNLTRNSKSLRER